MRRATSASRSASPARSRSTTCSSTARIRTTAAVPVRKHLDVITSDSTLAAAEIWLARQNTDQRSRILTKRLNLMQVSRRYDYVIIDCGPSLNLLNQNALSYADEVIIPVTCDYLALVGVKQVLRTIKDVERHLGHAVRVSGGAADVLRRPHAPRARGARDAAGSLQAQVPRADPAQHAARRGAEPPQDDAGDGQVTHGQEVLKASASKLRRLYNDKILAGFAGSTADAFSLFARFESKLEQYNGNLPRSVVELAKEWRTDQVLRHLEALLLVADPKNTYIVSGNGDVIEPDEGVAAIGSGGPFALAAATALLRNTKLSAREIAEKAMKIAGEICIYTNENITYEELG